MGTNGNGMREDANPRPISEGAPKPDSPAALVSWCLYDWANSGFPTVIVTFVFSAYFARAVAESPIVGAIQWGHALSLSALAIAIASPVFGAIADRGGRRKPWLMVFSVLCALGSAMLWFVKPDASWAIYALVVFAASNAAFEIAMVFYNAMLPELVKGERIGRLSGWGWSVGYAGGLTCLVIALLAFVQTERPLFGLDRESQEHVRIVGPMVALWFVVFALPLFLFTPDARSHGISFAEAMREGIRALWVTFREIRHHANTARFLVARMIYTDGLNTLFAFGGIYAAGVFGMDIAEIILFGIALNVSAGLGAAGFAWIDDWIGAKRTILISLIGLTALGVPLVLVQTKYWFWVLALALGVFMGPAQAASRSMIARLAPPNLRTEMFGLFALSGKATAFLGPLVLAETTRAFASQRAGMATVIIFFVVGGALILAVKEPRR